MKKSRVLIVSITLVMLLLWAGLSFGVSARPLAANAPGLGDAASFAVLGSQAVTSTGATVLGGNLGISPNDASSVTGFPPGTHTGLHAADALAGTARTAAFAAFDALDTNGCDQTLTGDLDGMTLTPGTYCYSTSAGIAGGGHLTLDGQGDPNAVFVFKIGSTLTTGVGSRIEYTNPGTGGAFCNVYWRVGSSATLGVTTTWLGTIIASESITMNTNATLIGRALALTASVTLDDNDITLPVCAAPPAPAAAAVPTIAGLPRSGGAPIQNSRFPLALLIVGGISIVGLFLGVQAYRRTH